MKTGEIRKYVRDRYAGIATRGGGCCGPSECCGPAGTAEDLGGRIGYSEEEMRSVPRGANLGLGCGNPTALASLRAGEVVLDLGSGAGFDCFLAAREVGESGRVIGVDMTPEMVEKYKRGPVGYLTVIPNGMPQIGKSLLQWFIYSLLVGVFVGYAASVSLAPGTPYLTVFRVTGTIAILAYGLSALPDSIWKGQRWGITGKFVFDGVLYGLVTAGSFAWLWPDA